MKKLINKTILYSIILLFSGCSQTDLALPQFTFEAGGNRLATIGSEVELNAITSIKNLEATYQWSFLEKPEGSEADFVNSKAPITSFTMDKAGDYVISLEAVHEGTVFQDELTVSNHEPVISSMTPISGEFTFGSQTYQPGDTVRIEGQNFSPNITENQVTISGEPMQMIRSTTEELLFVIPKFIERGTELQIQLGSKTVAFHEPVRIVIAPFAEWIKREYESNPLQTHPSHDKMGVQFTVERRLRLSHIGINFRNTHSSLIILSGKAPGIGIIRSDFEKIWSLQDQSEADNVFTYAKIVEDIILEPGYRYTLWTIHPQPSYWGILSQTHHPRIITFEGSVYSVNDEDPQGPHSPPINYDNEYMLYTCFDMILEVLDED